MDCARLRQLAGRSAVSSRGAEAVAGTQSESRERRSCGLLPAQRNRTSDIVALQNRADARNWWFCYLEGNTHSFRRIFLDGRAHNLDLEPNSWTGDSTGKWEGNTLVVDTIGFNDRTWLDDTGKPHSDQLQVTERYRRPDAGRLERFSIRLRILSSSPSRIPSPARSCPRAAKSRSGSAPSRTIWSRSNPTGPRAGYPAWR